MRCTSPREVGFKADGKTLSWSPRTHNKQYPLFKLPCTKCLACRLDYARQWAIRCVHEASVFKHNNCFITLTYSEENLKSPWLEYRDFQLFMKKLRKTYPNQEMGVFVTGEYGDKKKRPHWHAIIFNWCPPDPDNPETNERGDTTFTSKVLSKLWPQGKSNFGEVTFHSAGYVARYAAKKLVHGNDQDHKYQPISKKSSKNAIGKRWLEKNYKDVFNHGKLILKVKENGKDAYVESSIPRYYEKWLKKNHPTEWERYVTQTKQSFIQRAEQKAALEKAHEDKINETRRVELGPLYTKQQTREEARWKILKQKFEKLQSKLKL